jgi:hypothetical protein
MPQAKVSVLLPEFLDGLDDKVKCITILVVSCNVPGALSLFAFVIFF